MNEEEIKVEIEPLLTMFADAILALEKLMEMLPERTENGNSRER